MGVVKDVIVGAVVTLVIGGTAYTVNQADVVDNLAQDTGMSQQEAQNYVDTIKEEDLVSFKEVGTSYTTDAKDLLSYTADIDCVNYEYEWESPTLSCDQGKTQLNELGNDEMALGNSYIKLESENATRDDISTTIRLIDEVNAGYKLEIVGKLLDASTIDDGIKTNSYNKATLQAALESDNQ